MNGTSESGIDIHSDPRWADAGDLPCTGADSDMLLIERRAAEYWDGGLRILTLGGDHSITAPILRGVAGRYERITIVHFDAHPDLYPDYNGNRDSHASPFYRIMDEQLIVHLLQIGIRTANAIQREAIARFGVEVIPSDYARSWPGISGPDPVYVSVDMDALDPAFAPGVSHREPGGLSVREVLQALKCITAPILGADSVELNPEADPSGRTSIVGANF